MCWMRRRGRSVKIGNKIRDLRLRQNTTLNDLSKKAGLTTSFLSQLERDLVSPSICSLEKIAVALGTKIVYFFESNEKKELLFLKKGDGEICIDKEQKVKTELLASSILNIMMEPSIFTIEKGVELEDGKLSFREEKFEFVLKGKIELTAGNEKFIFEEGDSIYHILANAPVKIKNIGETEARLLCVVLRTV